MVFADRAVSERLERAEGHANATFIDTRARLEPESGATWRRIGGAYVLFDGPGSPLTQTFALGLTEPATPEALAATEVFFSKRGCAVHHEVSPLAGIDTYAALHGRGYSPVELTSVLFRSLESAGGHAPSAHSSVREATSADIDIYVDLAARGWSEAAEVQPWIKGLARLTAMNEHATALIAAVDGVPVATGAVVMADGVALLAGASTVPEGRGRGAQRALLAYRLEAARERGCDLAMMCAAPGSTSQRNAERHGFRVAYTRVKWRLALPGTV
jgi:GNAT superfamily N-acetyltransferase